MLSIKYLHENREEAIRRLAVKGFKGEQIIDELLGLDNDRRNSQRQLDENLAEQNRISKSIGLLMKEGKRDEAEAAKAQIASLKEGSKQMESRKKELEDRIQNLIIQIRTCLRTSSRKVQRQKTTYA